MQIVHATWQHAATTLVSISLALPLYNFCLFRTLLVDRNNFTLAKMTLVTQNFLLLALKTKMKTQLTHTHTCTFIEPLLPLMASESLLRFVYKRTATATITRQRFFQVKFVYIPLGNWVIVSACKRDGITMLLCDCSPLGHSLKSPATRWQRGACPTTGDNNNKPKDNNKNQNKTQQKNCLTLK